MNRWSSRDFYDRETFVYNTIMVNTCHYTLSKPIETVTPRVTTNINYGLWVLMRQSQFTDCNKFNTLVQVVDVGGGCVCQQEAVYGTRCTFYLNCCEPKTSIKHKSYI